MKISIVIPASGSGTRLGGTRPKQFQKLGGEPILKRTLSVFAALDFVNEIAVAVPKEYVQEVESYKIPKPTHIVTGKQTRAESVYAALTALSPETKIVLIHDGCRPFVTCETIEAVALAASFHDAAVACAPVTDTIKQTDQHGKIIATLNRDSLWQAQTPQGFTYETILRAYTVAHKSNTLHTATDDSSLAERLGIPVKIVPSPPSNIKITTPTDMTIAEAFLC